VPAASGRQSKLFYPCRANTPLSPSQVAQGDSETSGVRIAHWSDQGGAMPRRIAVRALARRAAHKGRGKNRAQESSFRKGLAGISRFQEVLDSSSQVLLPLSSRRTAAEIAEKTTTSLLRDATQLLAYMNDKSLLYSLTNVDINILANDEQLHARYTAPSCTPRRSR